MPVVRILMNDPVDATIDFAGGSVELNISEDQALTVFDYGRRAIDPMSNGLVFVAAPGAWVWARSFSDEEAVAQANHEGPIHDAS